MCRVSRPTSSSCRTAHCPTTTYIRYESGRAPPRALTAGPCTCSYGRALARTRTPSPCTRATPPPCSTMSSLHTVYVGFAPGGESSVTTIYCEDARLASRRPGPIQIYILHLIKRGRGSLGPWGLFNRVRLTLLGLREPNIPAGRALTTTAHNGGLGALGGGSPGRSA